MPELKLNLEAMIALAEQAKASGARFLKVSPDTWLKILRSLKKFKEERNQNGNRRGNTQGT